MQPKELEHITSDRSSWRTLFKEQVSVFERRRIQSLQDKRVVRKTGRQLSPDRGFTCDICSRVCALRIGLISHQRIHLWSRDPSCRRLSPTTRIVKEISGIFSLSGEWSPCLHNIRGRVLHYCIYAYVKSRLIT